MPRIAMWIGYGITAAAVTMGLVLVVMVVR